MRLSDLHEQTLDNGLHVLCMPHGKTPLAEVRLVVPELSSTPGSLFGAQLRAELAVLHRGDSAALRGDLEQSGVELSGGASPWATVLSGGCGTGELPQLLRFLAGAVSAPSVTPEDTTRHYEGFRTRLREASGYPHVRAFDGLYHYLYGDHTAGNHGGTARYGAPETEDGGPPVTPGGLGPEGALLLVVGGGLDPAEVFGRVREHFGAWRADTPGWVAPAVPALLRGELSVVDAPGSPRAHLRLRADAPAYDDDAYAPLFLALNTLSGGAVSTRLTRNLRNEHGYVYGASAFIDSFPGANLIAVEAETSVANVDEVLAGVGQVLRGMADHPPSEEEFLSAQRFAAGCMRTKLTSQAEVTGALIGLALNGLDPMKLTGFGDRLSRVTHDEVVDAARTYLVPERFTGIVCGDASALGSPTLHTHDTTPIEKAVS